jgi:hypothetical protein
VVVMVFVVRIVVEVKMWAHKRAAVFMFVCATVLRPNVQGESAQARQCSYAANGMWELTRGIETDTETKADRLRRVWTKE